jgi:histidinol phosphatase-like enzyme
VTVPTPAVLFDRDGTLVVNSRTTSIPRRSSRCLPRSRRRGCCDRKIPMAVVGNQSVVGRGWASIDDVAAANARVEIVAGRIGPFFICSHAPDAPGAPAASRSQDWCLRPRTRSVSTQPTWSSLRTGSATSRRNAERSV